MGVPRLFLVMFLRKKANRSGSTSVQLISKAHGKYKVIKTIGSGRTEQEVQKLWYKGQQEMGQLSTQSQLFTSQQDTVVEYVMESLANASIRTVGPELIFGKLYDHIGFGKIKEEMFRHLVICRLAFSAQQAQNRRIPLSLSGNPSGY